MSERTETSSARRSFCSTLVRSIRRESGTAHPSLENKSFNKYLGIFLSISHTTDAQLQVNFIIILVVL